MKSPYPSYDQIQKYQYKLQEMSNEYWYHTNLFSFQWWMLLFTLIVPWIIWVKYVDRGRIKEILLFGSLLMILAGFLDDIGVNCNLWSYPYKLTEIVGRLVAIDYGVLIVAHMFVYQLFKSWKSFLLVNFILAIIFSFIFEPFTVWIGIYKLEHWEYIYSLPIYVVKAAFVKWIVDVLLRKAQSA